MNKILQKYTQLQKGKLLDYGCGTGNFLHECQKAQWNIQGVEPEELARKQAEQLNKTNLFADLEQLKEQENEFDAISLWHVLEHIHDLNETLNIFFKLLKQNGILLIAVPNCASLDAQKWEEYWAAYDLPRHLYHFTPKTMEILMENHHFSIQKKLAMPYDAYYISLLSRKLKYKKTNLMKGFFDGLSSNRWANKNNQNYSSVLYILKKK